MGASKYKESAQGVTYHIYNRGNNKQKIFLEKSDYRFYLALLNKYSNDTNFSVIAYCLMPNHVHLLVKQNGEISPPKLLSKLHTSYAMYFNKKYRRVGHLFQDRYKQKVVINDNYLAQLICYIHLNPFNDGIVDLPEKYQWSSFGQYRQLGSKVAENGICDVATIKFLGLDSARYLIEIEKLAALVAPSDAFDN